MKYKNCLYIKSKGNFTLTGEGGRCHSLGSLLTYYFANTDEIITDLPMSRIWTEVDLTYNNFLIFDAYITVHPKQIL